MDFLVKNRRLNGSHLVKSPEWNRRRSAFLQTTCGSRVLSIPMICTILHIGTPHNQSLGIRGVHSDVPPHYRYSPALGLATISSTHSQVQYSPYKYRESIPNESGNSGDGLDQFDQLLAPSHNVLDPMCKICCAAFK